MTHLMKKQKTTQLAIRITATPPAQPSMMTSVFCSWFSTGPTELSTASLAPPVGLGLYGGSGLEVAVTMKSWEYSLDW